MTAPVPPTPKSGEGCICSFRTDVVRSGNSRIPRRTRIQNASCPVHGLPRRSAPSAPPKSDERPGAVSIDRHLLYTVADIARQHAVEHRYTESHKGFMCVDWTAICDALDLAEGTARAPAGVEQPEPESGDRDDPVNIIAYVLFADEDISAIEEAQCVIDQLAKRGYSIVAADDRSKS